MEKINYVDVIKLDENNRCVSANCIYTDDDKTIQYQFESEDERISFFENIQDYVYKDGKFVLDKLPKEQAQPTYEELQNDINIDFDFRISELELGI